MLKNSEIQKPNVLPLPGLMRVKQVLQYVPVSRSHWWAGVKSGKYPKPIKLSERVTVWRVADIRDLVEGNHPSVDKVIL